MSAVRPLVGVNHGQPVRLGTRCVRPTKFSRSSTSPTNAASSRQHRTPAWAGRVTAASAADRGLEVNRRRGRRRRAPSRDGGGTNGVAGDRRADAERRAQRPRFAALDRCRMPNGRDAVWRPLLSAGPAQRTPVCCPRDSRHLSARAARARLTAYREEIAARGSPRYPFPDSSS